VVFGALVPAQQREHVALIRSDDRPLADGHASVRYDCQRIQGQPHQEQSDTRDADVHRPHDEDQRVRRSEDGHPHEQVRAVTLVGKRQALDRESQWRQGPPPQAQSLEVAESPAGSESEDQRQDDGPDEQDHGCSVGTRVGGSPRLISSTTRRG
jgi:hypothetical protein